MPSIAFNLYLQLHRTQNALTKFRQALALRITEIVEVEVVLGQDDGDVTAALPIVPRIALHINKVVGNALEEHLGGETDEALYIEPGAHIERTRRKSSHAFHKIFGRQVVNVGLTEGALGTC